MIVNYFPYKQEGFFDILSLEMFSCQAITVSYAYANQHGVSSYSAPTSLTVPGSKLFHFIIIMLQNRNSSNWTGYSMLWHQQHDHATVITRVIFIMHAQSVCQHFFCFNSTVLISQPVSVLISSLRTEFIYDNRHGFFAHYKVNLTWTNPTGTHI